ncbi:hypothetical protein NDU88_007904 [Pleurodeles waltl]|uniref:Uncharacterized protein n=1 Tax=Pleurodeles waltl TaxID=8319 RepID=A0AAV7QM16_PLEWA|nr:hypothetical protein NDU88_007904 [Pleurodeles waltl]
MHGENRSPILGSRPHQSREDGTRPEERSAAGPAARARRRTRHGKVFDSRSHKKIAVLSTEEVEGQRYVEREYTCAWAGPLKRPHVLSLKEGAKYRPAGRASPLLRFSQNTDPYRGVRLPGDQARWRTPRLHSALVSDRNGALEVPKRTEPDIRIPRNLPIEGREERSVEEGKADGAGNPDIRVPEGFKSEEGLCAGRAEEEKDAEEIKAESVDKENSRENEKTSDPYLGEEGPVNT